MSEHTGDRCILCDRPWTPEHRKECPEWPRDDKGER